MLTGIAIMLALLLGSDERPTPALPLAPTHFVQEAEDAWLGDDKLRHFFMSFGGTAFAYGTARSLVGHDDAATFALSAGVAGGVGKEMHDLRAGRPFSARDLAWDALGLLAAWTLIRNTR